MVVGRSRPPRAAPRGSLTSPPAALPPRPILVLQHSATPAKARAHEAPLCGDITPIAKLWRWGALKVRVGPPTRGAIPAFSLRKAQARCPVAALNPDRGVIAVFPSLNSHPWGSLGTAAAVTSAGRAAPNSPLRHCQHPGGSGSSALLAGAGPGAVPGGGAESRAQ